MHEDLSKLINCLKELELNPSECNDGKAGGDVSFMLCERSDSSLLYN